MAAILPILRFIALGIAVVFSVIALGLAAHLTSLTNKFFHGYATFAALAIATSLLTIASVPVMLIVELLRKGAFTSMVVVELAWLGMLFFIILLQKHLCILWVLWLATAGTSADANASAFPRGCGFRRVPLYSTLCRELSALEAFAFLNWLILMGYTITLLVFSVIGASQGRKVWTSSVKEAASPPSQTTNPGYNPNEKDFPPTTPQNVPLESVAPQYPTQSMAPQYPPQSMAPEYPPQSLAPQYPHQPMSPEYPPQSMSPEYPPQPTSPQYPPQSMTPDLGDQYVTQHGYASQHSPYPQPQA